MDSKRKNKFSYDPKIAVLALWKTSALYEMIDSPDSVHQNKNLNNFRDLQEKL